MLYDTAAIANRFDQFNYTEKSAPTSSKRSRSCRPLWPLASRQPRCHGQHALLRKDRNYASNFFSPKLRDSQACDSHTNNVLDRRKEPYLMSPIFTTIQPNHRPLLHTHAQQNPVGETDNTPAVKLQRKKLRNQHVEQLQQSPSNSNSAMSSCTNANSEEMGGGSSPEQLSYLHFRKCVDLQDGSRLQIQINPNSRGLAHRQPLQKLEHQTQAPKPWYVP
jgi:hypothetical protein